MSKRERKSGGGGEGQRKGGKEREKRSEGNRDSKIFHINRDNA